VLFNKGIYGHDEQKLFPKLTLKNIISDNPTDVLFIHYTGATRRLFLKDHPFGDILQYFAKKFYNNAFLFQYNEVKRIILTAKNTFIKRVNARLNLILSKSQ
jgi:hypothetical protein